MFLSTSVFSISSGGISRQEVGQEVLDAYSLANPGANLEIMGVQESSGLYKVRLSTGEGEGTYQTVYATKDGEFFTQALTNLTQYTTMLQNRIDFLDCLEDEDVKIYGALKINDTQVTQASALQIQVLGGTNYLDNIYVDCSNNVQACAAEGIETLPSVKYRGELYPGVRQYEWFEENVGCELE